MMSPVMMINKPNFDLTFASAATARNKKKLASNRIFSIKESPHHN